MKKDQVHGGFNFHAIEKMVIVQAYGAWNIECVEDYIQQAEDYYQSTKLDQVDLIIDISELEGITPDAAMKLNEYNRLCRGREMFKSEAFYAPSSKIMLHMTFSLLRLSGARQVGISDYNTLMAYTSKLVGKETLKRILPLFSPDKDFRNE